MAVQADPFEIVGRKIDGRYEVVEVVEQTSFSVVYRATHVLWKRDVAIKAFKIASDFTEEARSGLLVSFVREGALLAELSERCTAICQARDVASFTTEAGQWVPYMVLEWVDGEALDLVLDRERAQGSRPRTVRDAIALLAPIAEALAVAHARGIVHCDVKPGNLLLLREGNGARSHVKLLDFGVAKVLRDSRQDAQHSIVEGSFTPAYAPEQWSSEHGTQGPATDVFALALIVVELVTGREALQGDQVDDLSRASCDPVRRPTPRALGVAVSDEVERVLSRALALNPANRFADAQQFWDALAAADAGVPSNDAERQTPTDVVIPLSRRRPRASSGAAAVSMLCACAAAGWHLSSQSAGHTTWLGAVVRSAAFFPPGAEWIKFPPTTSSTYAPLLATLCVVANALCTGTLFSVSWLCGRARMMADRPEIGQLAMQLFRRWTVPSLIVCLLSGGGWCGLVAQEHPQAFWLYGIALAGLALVGLNVTVGRSASQLVRGGPELTRGEDARRFA